MITEIGLAGFYLVLFVVLPPLLTGFIHTGKARLQNRRGPSILQPFYDMAKLLRKSETISETSTWVFRAAPLVNLAIMAAIGLMIPWAGVRSPLPGDLILVVYLAALGKFVMSLAALDTGSSFGAFGASREAAVSIQAEPALLMALAALAVRAHSSSFAAMLSAGRGRPDLYLITPMVLAALWLALTAELARMPVDDPTTHLELTMIHEALILENSGRSLAVLEIGAALKMTVMFGLLAQAFLMLFAPMAPPLHAAVTVVLIAVCGALIVVLESVLVKLRWRRIPNLLSYSLTAAALACLVVAVKG